ncbi:nuclease [Kitasatospora sp. NPDC004799]|uniref:nuclease n=1 Tax=Kitasatospora sp. NPDC004799 TaxID=3154460 RepID=UPI0033A33F41
MPAPAPTPMTLIKGRYQIKGSEPDGDTVKFLPDDITMWAKVPGERKVKTNQQGVASLRLDGIDALETHYQGAGPDFVHQPLDLGAHAARDALLTWLGFTAVERQLGETVSAATPETVPGFILTSGADTFNRCVALVGRGAPVPDAESGASITVDVPMLHQTANHELLSRGLVYPTFYKNLPKDLRFDMAVTAQQARAAKAPDSVWANDVTHSGAAIEDLGSLTDHLVILPKLFRRLADYLRLFGPSLDRLPVFLAGGDDEYFFNDPDRTTRGLHRIVDVVGDTVKLRPAIEELTFVEK